MTEVNGNTEGPLEIKVWYDDPGVEIDPFPLWVYSITVPRVALFITVREGTTPPVTIERGGATFGAPLTVPYADENPPEIPSPP